MFACFTPAVRGGKVPIDAQIHIIISATLHSDRQTYMNAYIVPVQLNSFYTEHQMHSERPSKQCDALCNITFVFFFPQLNFDLDRGVFPMVIQAVVDEGDGKL